MAKLFANSGDPDQTPRSVESDLGLHCLPITHLRVSRLQWVKRNISLKEETICLKCQSLFPGKNKNLSAVCQLMNLSTVREFVCVEFLQPSQPSGSCGARSVYLTTLLLGRLSPLKRLTSILHILLPETDALLESAEGRE